MFKLITIINKMDKIIFENFVLNPTNFVNPTYIAIQTNPTLSNENTTKIN